MSRLHTHRLVPLVVLATVLAVGVSAAHAGVCKPNGQQCQTSLSCCTSGAASA